MTLLLPLIQLNYGSSTTLVILPLLVKLFAYLGKWTLYHCVGRQHVKNTYKTILITHIQPNFNIKTPYSLQEIRISHL
ncbi:hypothetical protein HanXRQr2_Chr09g0363221 [Helianthus annuus]|uniref:Uncharacterized protein n=1 Tax=Helianthus annuus TaxID=4232 RepID=A0A251TQW8_HELAN|nr:hypothetical protein HanXRQr2_Chr09g0363221 [Helianthus annuus]KAJ0540602.1 hypothetical protein HanHA89_Chr09g0318651 [Helianthus annuus]KAJ0705756.1 hypothetical protein HanLR1_Chr09g0298961 [Helianthus annuus]KAJ0709901.1 hypothetical protein HanOQP8_Chr09g0305911 [Helianthus annuus]